MATDCYDAALAAAPRRWFEREKAAFIVDGLAERGVHITESNGRVRWRPWGAVGLQLICSMRRLKSHILAILRGNTEVGPCRVTHRLDLEPETLTYTVLQLEGELWVYDRINCTGLMIDLVEARLDFEAGLVRLMLARATGDTSILPEVLRRRWSLPIEPSRN